MSKVFWSFWKWIVAPICIHASVFLPWHPEGHKNNTGSVQNLSMIDITDNDKIEYRLGWTLYFQPTFLVKSPILPSRRTLHGVMGRVLDPIEGMSDQPIIGPCVIIWSLGSLLEGTLAAWRMSWYLPLHPFASKPGSLQTELPLPITYWSNIKAILKLETLQQFILSGCYINLQCENI